MIPTTFQHWQEWRTRCAAQLCAPATQTALRDFGAHRFQHYARAVLGQHDVRKQIPAPEECWHLLESELTTGRLRSGRRYKEWLFARLEGSPDAPINVIQGGASLLMRTVVRNWALREGRQRRSRPLDAPIGAPGSSLTLLDLLPAPEREDNLEVTEFDQQAAAEAQRLFETLPERTRKVVLAKQLGLPLYGTPMLAQLGTSRSGASVLWRGVFQSLAHQITRHYPDEPRAWQLKLSLRAAKKLEPLIFRWGRLEKSASQLFFMAEHSKVAAADMAAGEERHGTT
ncbi:MAG: hypothetical protein GX174_03800 [Lentisphaerae bacterium]|jgi:hypothetical protein|nr:hypothetical protein [Lentisphaerota bacterium]